MNNSISISRNLLTFGVPFGLFGVLIFFMKSAFLANSNALSLAVTTDLLLTIPLVYFLLIRKTPIPNTTVVPMMVLGLALGTYFLPKENQTYLALFKTWALPIVELSVVTLIIIKVRLAIKKYKSIKDESPDFFTALKNTCCEILPKKLVLPFATEIAVIYYGFINWRSRSIAENEFTYHKTSGTPALFGAIIFIIGIEIFALHILLMGWSELLAWILSGLSIYTAVQVLGFAKSLSQRPILVDENGLNLHYGILNEVKIPFEDIDQIQLSTKSVENMEEAKTLSPIGDLEGHNVMIRLNRRSTMTGLYGIRKDFKTLALYVDNPKEFQQKVEDSCKDKACTMRL